MAHLPKEVRVRTDALDRVTPQPQLARATPSVRQCSPRLALIAAYVTAAGIDKLDLLDPTMIPGILIGAMLPYLFSAMTMTVGKAAYGIVLEVRRQFKEIPA